MAIKVLSLHENMTGIRYSESRLHSVIGKISKSERRSSGFELVRVAVSSFWKDCEKLLLASKDKKRFMVDLKGVEGLHVILWL